MELIRGLHNLRPAHRGCVATIGAFDGIHRGHQAVLAGLRQRGREMGLPVAVVVFEPLPREFLHPEDSLPRLLSFRERAEALAASGVDRLLCIRFTEALRNMAPEEFVRRIFVEGLGVRHVILGDDLRFGRDRAGDANLVTRLGREYGFTADRTTTLMIDGERASSTRIRESLAAGDFAAAEAQLGRPYGIAGRVVRGAQIGRQLGAPTANVALRRRQPALAGVFAVEVRGLGPALRPGVANLGTRPTVDGSRRAVLEVHLFDYEADLYGQRIEVIFRDKLRDEQTFGSLTELQQNIHRDIASGRAYFGLPQSA